MIVCKHKPTVTRNLSPWNVCVNNFVLIFIVNSRTHESQLAVCETTTNVVVGILKLACDLHVSTVTLILKKNYAIACAENAHRSEPPPPGMEQLTMIQSLLYSMCQLEGKTKQKIMPK